MVQHVCEGALAEAKRVSSSSTCKRIHGVLLPSQAAFAAVCMRLLLAVSAPLNPHLRNPLDRNAHMQSTDATRKAPHAITPTSCQLNVYGAMRAWWRPPDNPKSANGRLVHVILHSSEYRRASKQTLLQSVQTKLLCIKKAQLKFLH